ncbi:uncharacterized protein LOC123011414 [Tribolium madens]|uniref:uncharacterized protein LOC123011414 n=1 Tax=Tribolium madens TaxID=41895 RepID=UPI001CF742AC|nr:uncharacterized protein LOC123011414 [Tribolium madens]
MSQAKFKKAVVLRKVAVDQLSDLKDIADRVSRKEELYESLYPELKARYNFIERMYSDFYLYHNEVLKELAGLDEETEEHDTIRKSFDRDYFSIQIIYNEIFQNSVHTQNLNSDTPSQSDITIKNHVKLPPMELYKFDGDIKSWRTFIDMFNSTVHNQNALTNVEKFSYLISTLSKEPLSIVSRIPMTDQNYRTAYDALIKRYENKRLLATSHWQQLENSPRLPDDYTPSQLRSLINTFDENLAALKTLNFPVDNWDFILFNMMLKRIPPSLVTRFELSQTYPADIPSYQSLNEFVITTCQAKENVSHAIIKSPYSKPNIVSSPKPKFKSNFLVKSDFLACPLCPDLQHGIYKCPIFLQKSPQSRFDLIKQYKWCINCLGSKHNLRNCNSTSLCRECGKKHHSLLHFPGDAKAQTSTFMEINKPSSPSTSTSTQQTVSSFTNLLPVNTRTTILLSTAVVEILDKVGAAHKIRVLLDSASQSSFITEKCVNRLRLLKQRLSFTINGLGDMRTRANKMVTCALRPVQQNSPQFLVDAIIVPKICSNVPNVALHTSSWSHIVNLKLADEQFHTPGEIDMLLGADLFPLIFDSECIQGGANEPTAIKTKFGWILMGKVAIKSHQIDQNINSFHLTMEQAELNESVKRFWEIEEPPNSHNSSQSSEDRLVEETFESKHYRDNSGRFAVPLFFKSNENSLTFPGSFSIALRRFLSLERRLIQNPSLYTEYVTFMQDYLSSGHMQASTSSSSIGYYIPHHSVIRMDSPTTKLRVVFDASCKSASGISLNDSLLVGPKLQSDLFQILVRFRFHSHVLIADIRQMFRQILILPEHRHFQKILWRFAPTDPIQEFQLNTVTYGIACSPYSAIRVIKRLAESDTESAFPQASRILSEDIYVDDIITGCPSIEEGLQIRNELITLLDRGGFQLRKWASNAPELLDGIPPEFCNTHPLNFDQESNSFIKILGLKWDPLSDCFAYQITPSKHSCTKRSLLSELARIFDPVGFLAPLTFFAKRMIQYLWTLGLSWDDAPPADVVARWSEFTSQMSCLTELHIPRKVTPNETVSCWLHGFSDASEAGYAAVVYLRTMSFTQQVNVKLLCAKSKVAPFKRISIPRLELCKANGECNRYTEWYD